MYIQHVSTTTITDTAKIVTYPTRYDRYSGSLENVTHLGTLIYLYEAMLFMFIQDKHLSTQHCDPLYRTSNKKTTTKLFLFRQSFVNIVTRTATQT